MKKLNFLFLLCLVSCSYGVKEKGGDVNYSYNPNLPFSSEDLHKRAPDYVKTSQRDPYVGKNKDLFAPAMPDIKKIGIISFEALIQPTFGGTAGQNSIYMSPAGKQIMTENLLSVWEQTLGVLGKDITYVKVAKINHAKTSAKYGNDVTDHVQVKRSKLMPDDIFYVEKGKKTNYTALLNPRGMRDFSMLLVPAYQMMGGPKFSETQKHYINEVCKELGLDGVLVVYSDLDWSVRDYDKDKKADVSEELRIQISASLILPFSNYHNRLDLTGHKGIKPQHNITYRAYDTDVKVNVVITVPEEDKNFSSVEKNLLTPMMDVYTQLTQMIVLSLRDDMKKTY